MHHTGTGYDQAAIVLLLHQSIGLDGARWVLEPFEASQLQQYGFVSRNAKALEDLVDFQAGHRPVFLTQWINRWRNQELGDGKAMRESGERKNGRVISNQEATEKAPAVLPGLGNVEVAAPEPLPSLPVLDQCRGRGIMDHYEIRIQVQSLGRALIDSEIDLLHLLGQVVVLALKRIGQSSGDLKEFLIAYQDLPTSINAKRVQHWYQPSKNLGHAAAIPT